MNKKVNKKLIKKKSLFTSSMFTFVKVKSLVTDDNTSYDSENREDSKDRIYKKSIIVGGVDTKKEENLEFLLSNQTLPENDNLKLNLNKSDSFE